MRDSIYIIDFYEPMADIHTEPDIYFHNKYYVEKYLEKLGYEHVSDDDYTQIEGIGMAKILELPLYCED